MTQNEKAARKKKIMHAVMWVVLLILFICFVAPFILVVINVFKTKGDITSNPLIRLRSQRKKKERSRAY